MGQKRWSIRLDEQLAATVEVIADMRDQSINQLVVQQLEELVAASRDDSAFREQVEQSLRRRTEAMRALLE